MEETLYLVQGYNGAYERTFAKVMTAGEIFGMMNMADCSDELAEIELWKLNGYGEAPTECSFLGKWHDRNAPQKMCIVGGGERHYCYGTEH